MGTRLPKPLYSRRPPSRYKTDTGSLTALTADATPLGPSTDIRTTTRYRPGASDAGSSVGPDRVPCGSRIHASIVHIRPSSGTAPHDPPLSRSSDRAHGLNE